MTAAPSASGLFLLFGEVRDVFVTYGFSHHGTLLVLRIQSFVPLAFNLLPFVLHIDSGYLECRASSERHNFLKILHSLIDGISCLSLIFSDCDLELLMLIE